MLCGCQIRRAIFTENRAELVCFLPMFNEPREQVDSEQAGRESLLAEVDMARRYSSGCPIQVVVASCGMLQHFVDFIANCY